MTTKLEQAARQALEALELIANVAAMEYEYKRWAKTGITALREALAERKVLTMTQEEIVDAIRSARIEEAEQEPIKSPDKGLWTVKQWGTNKVVLLSGDFTHDVALAISGDFLDIEQRLDYALNLAAWMNQHLQNAAPVRTKDLTDDVCDEIIKMAEKECGVSTIGWDCLDPRFIVRAVISADREKNR